MSRWLFDLDTLLLNSTGQPGLQNGHRPGQRGGPVVLEVEAAADRQYHEPEVLRPCRKAANSSPLIAAEVLEFCLSDRCRKPFPTLLESLPTYIKRGRLARREG